jgi:hypothetical protein
MRRCHGLTQVLTRLPRHGASWPSRRLFERRVLRFVFSFALVVPVLAGVTGASASRNAGAVQPGQRLEIDISNNANGGTGKTTMGEPEISQNPLNRGDLFIVWNTFAYPASTGGSSPVPNPCGGAVSHDRGITWQFETVPLTPGNPAGNLCADGVTAWGPDGTLYAGGIVTTKTSFHPAPCNPGEIVFAGVCLLVQGYDAIVRSTDGGQTWSAPARTMGSAVNGPFTFVGGNPQNTFDRPFLAVDQSTGTIYATGHNIADHETFVTASADGGQSFGTIYAADSPTYPSNGLPGGTIAAAHGVLAVAYTAASAPNATCPCVIFETSTDGGATFSRHVVPVMNAVSIPRPFVAADPATPGRFALTVFDSTGTKNQVYVTDDYGQTWHGPTDVGEAPPNLQFKPWLSFGPSGQLALVWRTWHGTPGTSPYDVWAAVGRDEGANGAVFTAPVKVSSVAAPYPPLNPGGGGDDFSFILADNQYVHVGWGDSRSGRTEAWYGRISLPTFKGQG